MAMKHDLKTERRYWQSIENGSKTFEVRRDDRGYAVGDTLVLHEWWQEPRSDQPCMCNDARCSKKTRRVERLVTYVLPGGQFGIDPGYVVLGLAEPIQNTVE